MSIETKREKLIYYGAVPIIAAAIGATVTAWMQAYAFDQSQSLDVAAILADKTLTGKEKLQALQIYSNMTDRPWAIARSLTNFLFVALGVFGGAIASRIWAR